MCRNDSEVILLAKQRKLDPNGLLMYQNEVQRGYSIICKRAKVNHFIKAKPHISESSGEISACMRTPCLVGFQVGRASPGPPRVQYSA